MIHDKRKFTRRLLAWYRKNGRRLPWRKTSDPYKIWISEVMLQQTQVATATDYYHRFVRRFPDVHTLAAASLDDVMKAWENLGYYSRARNLHRAARIIVDRFGGVLPEETEDLLQLPGVGPYISGAVSSIAFGKRVPVVDGNVQRVFTRIFHITDTVTQTATQKRLWLAARDMLPRSGAGDFNQALMELGAMICLPSKPLCPECPVRDMCEANRLSIQEALPVKPPGKSVPHHDVVACIIWKGDRFLITLRPPSGLLGGLWEFPGGKVNPRETLVSALQREIREELAIDIRNIRQLVSVRHAYTHFRITLHLFQSRYHGGKIILNGPDAFRWITADELDQFAFPAANRKAIKMLKENKKRGWI